MPGEAAPPGLRVGLFGGSFNPAHAGHRHVAETALARLQLDRVWWLVSPQNPLKETCETSALVDRMAAVSALATGPRHVVSDMESRLGVTTTVDTLSALVRRYRGVHFVWIMGADNLASFHHWRGWRSIAQTVPICVIARPGDAIRARLGRAAQLLRTHRIAEENAAAVVEMTPPAWVYLTTRLHPASSTALRAAGLTRQPPG